MTAAAPPAPPPPPVGAVGAQAGGRRRRHAPPTPLHLDLATGTATQVPAAPQGAAGAPQARPLGNPATTLPPDPRGRRGKRASESPEQREERRKRDQAARERRYKFRDLLRPITSLKRVRRCGDGAVSSGGVTVGVATNPDGSRHAAFGGIGTCGSVWSCPQCAAKVATRRADELADVMRAVDALGGVAYLLTLTMRHVLGDRLGWTRQQRRAAHRLTLKLRDYRHRVELGEQVDQAAVTADREALDGLVVERGCLDAATDGWAAVTSGRQWTADQQAHEMLGWAKVTETTHGANGWHVHAHALLCFAGDVPLEEARAIAERMFNRWKAALERAGFDASGDLAADGRIPGWDIRRAQLGDGDLADYFMKLAHEITSGHRKESRRPGGRTPLMLAREAVETYEVVAVARWWEWEAASDGRKQLTWSGGGRDLRRLAGLGAERTDEQIAAEQTDPEQRIGLAPETWGWIRAEGHVTRVLVIAEDEGISGLLGWLDAHGQLYVRGAGVGWVDRPEVPPDTPVPRGQGVGLGWLESTPAVLRGRDVAGRPRRRPSDRPPRWTQDARAILTRAQELGS